jgi:2-phospho-L-lactate/phosphoenolpyruvate guanylyltransferase
MDDAAPARPRVVAIVPIGVLENAKSRLGGTLDAEERRDLVDTMIVRTLQATLATPGLDETLVVSPDREAIDQAAFLGARTMRQRGQGLNAGIREARDDAIAGGADAIVILPIDLPLVTPDAIAQLLAPPDAIEPSFGGDSRAAHRACATDAGARYVELDGPLGLDIDTPDDLLLVEALAENATDTLKTLETADAG